MTLLRVYLDQRERVRLTRQHYGVENNKEVAGVLALVREASASGHASFPLSASHYMETFSRRDIAARRRLGMFMAEISQYHTIAAAPDLLDDEIDSAVCKLLGLPVRRSPRPFGLGAGRAFGDPDLKYFTDAELERRATAALGSEVIFRYFESGLLPGPAEQAPVPTHEFAQRQLDFELETAEKLRVWGHSSDRAHRLVLAQESLDLVSH
jgi:hypothetical protein